MSYFKCNTINAVPARCLLPGLAAATLLWTAPLLAERLDDTSIYIHSLSCSSSQVSAPAVTLNTYNKLQHRDDMYYAVFQPGSSTRWTGNIKKYRVSSSGDIFDKENESAVDPATGYFAKSSRSFWSEHPDGNDVSLGGFRDKLPAVRTVYTTDAAGTRPLSHADIGAADLDLPPGDPNTGYTAKDEEVADRLVDWALGENVFDNEAETGNRFVADPLHSQPVVINYGCRIPEADGSCLSDNLDDTLYVATNLGYLHAINAVSGDEHFSFIPRELLKNLPAYADHAPAEPGKVYGLDGTLTVLRRENPEDIDQDIEPEDGDSVLLYAGMRRGGSSYHALDVTDRDAPRHIWQIDGPALTNKFAYSDTGALQELADTGDKGFEDLGQTWSAARLASINWDCAADGTACTHRTVLVFTGGYDPRHDENSLDTTSDPTLSDEFGNAVYIVDAYTGALLWSAGNNNDTRTQRNHDLGLPITHSIVASPGLADTDGDGALDIIFAVDIAGGVWRIDINARSRNTADFASGGMIFDLEEKGQFRRFYNRPDVVLNTPRGGQAFAALIFGSGYRADPANTSQRDQVYVLFEDPVFALPGDEDEDGNPYNDGLIPEDQLYRVRTQNELGQPVASPGREGNAPNGYIIPLEYPGEKVLQPTLTLNNVAVVTTYLPPGITDTDKTEMNCGDKPLGSGRAYLFDIENGERVLDTEFFDLEFSGIPAKPTLVFSGSPTGGTVPVICIGAVCFGQGQAASDALGTIDIAHKSYWRENTDEDEIEIR